MDDLKYYEMDYLKRYLKDTTTDIPFDFMKEIKSLKSRIYAPGKDEFKELWVKIQNPTFEEFKKDYLEEYPGSENDEIKQEFQGKYDEPYSFYLLQFVSLKDGRKYLFVDHNMTINYDPDETNNLWENQETQLKEIIQKLNKFINKHIEMIKKGVYQKEILDQLPYYQKTGTIVREQFWKALKDKSNYDEFDDFKNKSEFLNSLEEAKKEKPDKRIYKMTSRIFFNCCLAGYIENGYEKPDADPKAAYKRHADGRDNGLLDINETKESSFNLWYHEPHYGHPWEILRGGNSTHVSLYVSHDEKGWYFTVDGSSENRFLEAINCYIAIKRMGYPVILNKAEKLAERLSGTEIIGIVPMDITPRYCENLFPGKNIINFINLYEEEKVALPYIKWQQIPVPELQESK